MRLRRRFPSRVQPSLIGSGTIEPDQALSSWKLEFRTCQCFWPYRLTVRTEPSQGSNTGSIPVKATPKMTGVSDPPKGGEANSIVILRIRHLFGGAKTTKVSKSQTKLTSVSFSASRRSRDLSRYLNNTSFLVSVKSPACSRPKYTPLG